MRPYQPSIEYPGTVIAPSASDLDRSTRASMSKSDTLPRPSQRTHIPPVIENSAFSRVPSAFLSTPEPVADATLNEYALGPPRWGSARRLKRIRSIAPVSVAVPTVDLGSDPIRSWSTTIAVVNPSRTSTSGRASVGMKPWRKAL